MKDPREMTKAEREQRRADLISEGSLFEEESRCGLNRVVCGLCDECAEQGVLDDLNDGQ